MSLDPLIADIPEYCGLDDALSICATLRSSGFGKNGCAPSSERTSLSCRADLQGKKQGNLVFFALFGLDLIVFAPDSHVFSGR